MELYQELASLLKWRKTVNEEYQKQLEDKLDILTNYLPSGSGFDDGSVVDVNKSNNNKIIIHSAYHHLDNNGFYDGWSNFSIIIKPDLMFGFTLTLIGNTTIRKYFDCDFRNYVIDIFSDTLHKKI